MQSRHSIVIQEASRFPRDTAFSIYNYTLINACLQDSKPLQVDAVSTLNRHPRGEQDSKPLQVDAVSTPNRHPRREQDSKPLQVDAVSTPNRHPIGNQDSKPLQVDAVSTPNRHPIGNQVSSRYDLFYLQPHTLVCRTVNLYRLMQSRHSIVIQEAIRFPRDTAYLQLHIRSTLALQVDAVSTPNRHPIGNQDSKPLQVDAVLTLNRHPRGETVNLYRLMQSRHPIVIQEASRFPRDTAFSIYNYILAHLRHRDGKWHHEPPGNKCTVHLSISHLPTTYKYNLYYPPTEVTDVAVM
ncbi:hypothetical protein J6590_095820 [Homalodisca vitripennis]|nr:hypothetical protein J6590_095820 [Homalodisca vitripennis]